MELLVLSKYFLAILLIIAGILHFVKPHFYKMIMPTYLPAHVTLIILSGIAEIVCGFLLLFPETQNLGVYATIALLIAVFPANIEMSRKYYRRKKKGFWLTVLRLPLQLVLVWWVFQFLK